jgi:integrase
MSVDEVIASKPKKTLTVTTINKYIRRLSGFFNYAVRNGYMLVNPAEGMKIKTQQRADQEREAYTIEDLQKLFDADGFKRGKHSYCRWAPLIALYSGCRLEEICQLHLDDIRQEEGVWVFDINDKNEKRLKTRSSARLVPIHLRLIDLGLLEYVEKLRASGENRLFPELRQRRDGYGQTVSKWFQRYKKICGISEGKTFHSFRHTFITHLKHKQVDPFMIHELDGHTIESETMGRYGKRYTPEILLREAIEKIDYGLTFTQP